MTVKVIAAGIKKYTARRHKPDKPVFQKNKAYHVHGFDHDDEGNGYVILVNEYREFFWISNKVVRVIQDKPIDVKRIWDEFTRVSKKTKK